MNVFLGLGTNLGDKEENLRSAVREIKSRIGHIVALSSFYETEPWGFESENSFLNAAVEVDTDLSPSSLLSTIKDIEISMGREQKSVNGVYKDRPIDIDILLYGDLVIDEEELQIPHPLMQERDFVMCPLREIASSVVHPLIGRTIGDI